MNEIINNDIIKFDYNGYKFEIDVWENNIIFIDETIIQLFEEAGIHGVEKQQLNVFLSRLVKLLKSWKSETFPLLNKKAIEITNDDSDNFILPPSNS